MPANRAPGHWVWDNGQIGYLWSILDDHYPRFVLSDPRNFTPLLTPGKVITVPNSGRAYYFVLISPDFSQYTYVGSPDTVATDPGVVLSVTLPPNFNDAWQVEFLDYGPLPFVGSHTEGGYTPVTPKADRFPWLPDAIAPAFNMSLWNGSVEQHLAPDGVFNGTQTLLVDGDSIL